MQVNPATQDCIKGDAPLKIACLGLSFLVSVIAGVSDLRAATVRWTGAVSTNWSTAGNWTGGSGVPQAADDVVIDGSYTYAPFLDLSSASVTINSLALGTNAGSVLTIGSGNTNRLFIITGNCTIGSTGTLTHASNDQYSDTLETHRLFMQVGGNFTLATNGLIDLEGRGHRPGYGLGKNGPTATNWRGSGYGGKGTSYDGYDDGTRTYGSITAPTNIGSGGGSTMAAAGVERSGYGGGALILTVTGTATINGRIKADGTTVDIGGGSGGSVFIRANAIAGTGEISADGGPAKRYADGGGGRVALITAGTDFGSVRCHAYSRKATGHYGPTVGGAGTVYLEKSGDAPGKGTLIVDNNDEITASFITTMQNWTDPSSYQFSTIILTNGGRYALNTNNTLDIRTTVILGDPTDDKDGLESDGGSIISPSTFVFSNYYIRLKATNVVFSPSASLTVGDKAQFIVDKSNTLNCSLTVNPGGKITHSPHLSYNLYPLYFDVYKVDLTINGNFTLQNGSSINVDSNGYYPNEGPGRATGASFTKYAGAGYGGQGAEGGDGSAYPGGATYGSLRAPVDLGSGAGNAGYGGGAVIMRVSGTAAINGNISANGASMGGSSSGNGSGGSVFLTANSFSGSGSISANGGSNIYSTIGQGGGGRIALVTAGADFGSIAMQAYGGGGASIYRGAAGTIYLETAAQGAGNGDLFVDALNNAGQVVNATTLISTGVTDKAVGSVIIRNGGRFALAEGERLAVARDWTNRGAFIAGTNSTVTFASSASATVVGTNTFWNLSITNAGKTVAFEALATNSVIGALTLRGAAGSLVNLGSTSPGGFWRLTLLPGSSHSVSYVAVQDSDASGGDPVGATDSEDRGHNRNWVFGGGAITWDGSESSDWGTAANWDLNRLPIELDTVVIPDTANDPELDANRAISGLVIQTGGELKLNGHNLTVNNLVDVNGVLTASGSETITCKGNVDFTGGQFTPASSSLILAGASDQIVTSGSAVYSTLLVANVSHVVAFADGFTAAELKCETAGANIRFHAGAVYAVERVKLVGQAGNRIALRSDSAGTRWRLNVGGWNYVSAVDVGDSDASGGVVISAINSLDSGNNVNWHFNSWSMWTGAASSNFMDAANWSPAVKPGTNSEIYIDGGQPVLSEQLTIARLAIGETAASTLTLDAPLSVRTYVDVMPNGVITHSSNINVEAYKVIMDVGQDFRVHAGGQINVDGRGYSSPYGPGNPSYWGGSDYRCGASHGGRGAVNSDYGRNPGPCYGSVTNPVNLGSSSARTVNGGGAGGGAVILTVGNKLIVRGVISANGASRPVGADEGGGAGGSINIRADDIEGDGVIRANGGTAAPAKGNGSGGGGRVAIALGSGTDFDALTIEAHTVYEAGNTIGAAGTVYLKTGGQSYGALVVDNDNNDSTDNYGLIRTDISDIVTDAVVGDVMIRRSGEMRLMTNQSFTICGDLKTESNGRLDILTNTLVVLTGSDEAVIYGSNTFHNLTAVGEGKKIHFGANTLQVVYGTMRLSGVSVESSAPGVQWRLRLMNPCGPGEVQNVAARDSDASSGNTVKAFDSYDGGNNLNWEFTRPDGAYLRVW